MSLDQNLNKILIIDFGSQFTQLIARRVRELGVFSEIVSHKKIKLKDINHSIKGIVLSGGPLNVYQINKYSFDKKILQLDVPVLGICFGHQILSKLNGGRVKQSKHREFGLANVYKKNNSLLTTNFFGNKKSKQVWMSHADQVSKLPKSFKVVASSTNSKFAIVENKIKKYYGVQFHPEVTHTENGKRLISNFIFLICKIKRNWSSRDQKNQLIKDVRKQVGNNKVICALSGGVDSSVVAKLISNAIVKSKIKNKITTTTQLSNIIKDIHPEKNKKIHPATKSFQAFRIFINNELEEFAESLKAAEKLLKLGGYIVTIAFHSLEDNIIKNFFKPSLVSFPKDIPINNKEEKKFKCIAKKVRASKDETNINPRSRSAIMRVFQKI